MLIVNLLSIKINKQCLTALFITIFQFIYCQKQFVVIDSITKEKIEFAKIEFDNSYYYTDSLGKFILKDYADNSFFILSQTGYQSKKIIVDNINGEILLKPREIEIEEVLINANKEITLGNRIYKKSTTSLTNVVELGIFVDNINNHSGFINSLEFFIKKNENEKNDYLEISFIQVDEKNNFDDSDKITIVKSINEILKFKNKVDLKNYKIPFNKNGILIGLKLVNQVGSNKKDFSKNILQFYNSKSKEFIYLKKSDGWIKYPTKVDAINIILHIN